MTSFNAAASITQPRLREALNRVRAEMQGLDESQYLTVNLEILAATSTALGAMPEIKQLRAEIAEELPKFDLTQLDKVETYALAAMQAHTVYLGAYTAPECIPGLVEQAIAMRELLLTDATALAKRGLLSSAKLAELKGTNGHRNSASDLLTLANMFRANWQAIAPKTAVTEAELDRAEILGDQIITALGYKEQAPAILADVAVERTQAYTLFMRAYDQLRKAVNYLRWDEGDADAIAPSLYAGRSNGRRKTGSETTEPPAATASSVVASPAPTTATSPATAVAVGLPGSNPFQG
jgi:hypothetical protein